MVSSQELTPEHLQDWAEIRRGNAIFRSPFFSSEFIQAVGKVLPETRVAVARSSTSQTAFLPVSLHRSKATPPGSGINDAHGLLAAETFSASICDLLDAWGIRSFAFHASPPECSGVKDFEVGRERSFLADLQVDPLGYEHFLRKRNRTIDKQGQKTRKLARQEGGLRFEWDCRDEKVLQRLLQLKSEQYQRTHTFDIFSVTWIQQLIVDLFRKQSGEVRGLLSVLYAGNTPAAIHFGMIEGCLLHYWFPVFDPTFEYGSPGTQLFLDVVNEAPHRGVTAVDMGYGEQAYKHKLTNVITEMSFGLCDKNPMRRIAYRTRRQLARRSKQWRIRHLAKPFLRKAIPSIGQNKYAP